MTNGTNPRERIKHKRRQLSEARETTAEIAAEIEAVRAEIETIRRTNADGDEDELKEELDNLRQKFSEQTDRIETIERDLNDLLR